MKELYPCIHPAQQQIPTREAGPAINGPETADSRPDN